MSVRLTVVLLLLVALMLGVLLARRLRRSARMGGRGILIGEAMRRRRITPADAAAAGRETDMLRARERCAGCADEDACRAALTGSARADVPAGCPNRAFFAEVASHRDAQPAPLPTPALPPG